MGGFDKEYRVDKFKPKIFKMLKERKMEFREDVILEDLK
jgi:hypothetical protein